MTDSRMIDSPDSGSAITVRARWIVSPDRPPLANGFVTIVDGMIVAIESSSSERHVDLGDVALLPSLVNAHTHLEFSYLTQPVGQSGMPFVNWLREVVQSRQDIGFVSKRRNIEQGLSESLASGVAFLGEIATTPWELFSDEETPANTDRLSDHFPTGMVAFQEWVALRPDRYTALEKSLKALSQMLAGHSSDAQKEAAKWLIPGISPHAPYSVHPDIFLGACELSKKYQLPMAMHLAESRDELELLNNGTGPFREFLESLNVFHPDAFAAQRSVQWYLERMQPLSRALVVHGNYLTNDEIALLAENRDSMRVVFCPRTHSYFGHDKYPLADYLGAGVRVVLGTESRASSPDLNLWEEWRHVIFEHPDVSPQEALKMITSESAEALGVGHRWGRIQMGRHATMCWLPVDPAQSDAYQALAESEIERPLPLILDDDHMVPLTGS